jgi:hypothetical protein
MKKECLSNKKILLADRNPLFAQISESACTQNEGDFSVCVNDDLKTIMSPNHKWKGQNVLYSDGSVTFVKVRRINNDDIYMLKGIDVYVGREKPCKGDTFLVP